MNQCFCSNSGFLIGEKCFMFDLEYIIGLHWLIIEGNWVYEFNLITRSLCSFSELLRIRLCLTFSPLYWISQSRCWHNAEWMSLVCSIIYKQHNGNQYYPQIIIYHFSFLGFNKLLSFWIRFNFWNFYFNDLGLSKWCSRTWSCKVPALLLQPFV